MILLLDADILVYQAACKNQEDYNWGDGIESHEADLEAAKVTLDNDLARYLKATKCTECLLALSSSPNFRYDVLPTYKHNRKASPKPILRDSLQEYVINTYPTKRKPTLEGDDILGIMATISPNKYIIATIDKDMKQIAGKHYNWNTEQIYAVTEREGDRWFYTQVLTGDPGDGYSGCPGIGKARAEKIIQAVDEDSSLWATDRQWHVAIWRAIVKQYMLKGLHEEDALQQARVARILRASDYDFKKNQVKLWEPPDAFV